MDFYLQICYTVCVFITLTYSHYLANSVHSNHTTTSRACLHQHVNIAIKWESGAAFSIIEHIRACPI